MFALVTRLDRPISPKLALALRSSCDGHHKKALFIAKLRKKNRAFLTAPALAGISRDLMQSHWTKATDDCRRRPIGLCADAQIEDDGPNMETYHEDTYRSSRVGHAYCGPDIRSPRERGSGVSGELLIRVERLLSDDQGLLIGPPAMRRAFGDGSRIEVGFRRTRLVTAAFRRAAAYPDLLNEEVLQ